MKKLVFISLFIIAVISCKKTEWSPEGPTDVRVKNLQPSETFYNVIIRTAGGRDTTGNIKKLGNIAPGDTSIFQRVTFAYPKAEITATINGQLFSTGEFQSTYMQYISRFRITYEVYISNMTNRVLTINNVSYEEPLVLK
ncbi:MAG: hypothetical protein MUF36_13115 [Bacteroidales bacterium]|jgi:hypothetical protein|nr:hypothetical protein [Bacteroidales bacterium]